MPTPSILILGAGELGSAILAALLAHPALTSTPITVLTTPHSTTPLPPSATRLSFDLVAATPAALAALFATYDTLLSCLGFVAPRGVALQLKIARAAVDAGVRRFVPWQYGLDYDAIGKGSAQALFDEQLEVRGLLRGQRGTGWVVVQTGVFASFLFGTGWGIVDVEGEEVVVRALGAWGTRVTVTDVRDIGRCVAALLGEKRPIAYSTMLGEWERFEGGVVRVAGATVSYGELAGVVEQVAGEKGRGVRREEWRMERLRGELEEARGTEEEGLRAYRVVFGEGRGTAWEVSESWNEGRGMKMVGLEEWVRKVV